MISASSTITIQQNPSLFVNSSVLQEAKVISTVFTAEDLALLKQRALGENKADWISTRDALLAHIWRKFLQYSPDIPEDATVRLSVIVDARSRFSPAVPDNYAGNATVTVQVQAGTKSQTLKELDLGGLARVIRRTIQEYTSPQYLKGMVSTMARRSGQAQSSLFGGFVLGQDCTSSDWTHFDWYGVSFAPGGAAQTRPAAIAPSKPFTMPGLVMLLPRPPVSSSSSSSPATTPASSASSSSSSSSSPAPPSPGGSVSVGGAGGIEGGLIAMVHVTGAQCKAGITFAVSGGSPRS